MNPTFIRATAVPSFFTFIIDSDMVTHKTGDLTPKTSKVIRDFFANYWLVTRECYSVLLEVRRFG
jgi:hypothetical protein